MAPKLNEVRKGLIVISTEMSLGAFLPLNECQERFPIKPFGIKITGVLEVGWNPRRIFVGSMIACPKWQDGFEYVAVF